MSRCLTTRRLFSPTVRGLEAPLPLSFFPRSFAAASAKDGSNADPRSDPRYYPDRPERPEARPIVEPPGDESLGGGIESEEGGEYVSLMQQIVGAVKVRPADEGHRNKLEIMKRRLEEDELKRGSKEGTVTVLELVQILREAQAKSPISTQFVKELADRYKLDSDLLARVLTSVTLVDEEPLRDGGKLLGIE